MEITTSETILNILLSMKLYFASECGKIITVMHLPLTVVDGSKSHSEMVCLFFLITPVCKNHRKELSDRLFHLPINTLTFT